MYSSLKIQNFRGFERVALNGLGRLNLLLGPNGAGKTTALEAVFLSGCGPNLGPFLHLPIRSRVGQFIDPLDVGLSLRQLFRDASQEIRLTVEMRPGPAGEASTSTPWSAPLLEKGAGLVFSYRFEPTAILAPLYPGRALPSTAGVQLQQELPSGGSVAIDAIGTWRFGAEVAGEPAGVPFAYGSRVFVPVTLPLIGAQPMVSPETERFAQVAWLDSISHRRRHDLVELLSVLLLQDQLGEVERVLRGLFRGFTKLELIPLPGGTGSNVYLSFEDQPRLEVSVFGEGLRRWLHVVATLVRYRGAVLTIDEIDAGLHPYLGTETTALLLQQIEALDSQVFATTHNVEFLDALLRSAYGDEHRPTAEGEDPIVVFTLRRDADGKHHVRRRTGREAWEARQDVAAELRA